MRDAMDSPPDDASDPMIGRQVRDLRILERIGRGGMGAVYKVEHLLLREIRALKMIRAERFNAVPQALERFQREARIAVRLRHPNLVLIYDFFIEGGDQFLVMEYVVGESLAARIREHGALSIDETCSIGMQCCAGLAYAHDMGIVHRDLSPENILLRAAPDDARVKIIDFGIARAAVSESDLTLSGEEATLTRGGDFLGKPRYASPEQAGKLRAGETLDPRSDLYTLGLILYEMVTGDLPFHSDTEIGYLSLHAFEPPPPPTRIRPDLPIPPALEQVILRCLEKDRAHRFPDARAVAAALEWAWHSGDLAQAPFPIAPPTDSQETRLFDSVDTTRWREEAQQPSAPQAAGEEARDGASGVAPLVGLALLAGVSAGIAVWWWTGSRTPPAEEPPGLIASAPSESESAKPAFVEPKPARLTELAANTQARPVEPPPKPEPTDAASRSKEPSAAAHVPTGPPHAATPPAASAPTVPRLASSAPPLTKPTPPKPAPAVTGIPPFADEAEMRQSFDEAVRFEESHDAAAAIESWKRFRARSPVHELDEEAKRHITRLTLAGLKDVR
jgi:eukaryotic-like serine/threonine-protein kinase